MAAPHLPPARRKKLTNERGVRGAGGGWSYRAARSMRIFALNSNLISLYCHLEIVKICTTPHWPTYTPLSGVEPTWAERKTEEASCFTLQDSIKYYRVYPVLSVHIDMMVLLHRVMITRPGPPPAVVAVTRVLVSAASPLSGRMLLEHTGSVAALMCASTLPSLPCHNY